MTDRTYIVATVKSWNQDAFHRHTPSLPGHWILMDQREKLTVDALVELNPRYVFFPHWSWQVPAAVLDATECVCFHMTDVPYGRGSSPLQNLIHRGHETTMLSALRMTNELDAGPVYLKKPLDISGKAQDIYESAADMVYDMIAEILDQDPEPKPQEGEVVRFERRTPDQSRLPDSATPRELYNHIRMLDAETYPRAFIEDGLCRIEFHDAELSGDQITAKAIIRLMGD